MRIVYWGLVSAKLVCAEVNSRERRQRSLMGKAAHIADLGHELRAERICNTIQIHDNILFGKFLGKPVHFSTKHFNRFGDSVELGNCFLHHYSRQRIFQLHGNQFFRFRIPSVA